MSLKTKTPYISSKIYTMKKTIKLILLWILLFIPTVVVLTTPFYGLSKGYEGHFNSNIGKKFELNNVVDSLGNKVNLKFESDVTIIDFWFVGCGFCVYEMNQFNDLLKGREKEISVISISVDAAEYWKTPNSPYLTNTSNNWTFFGLESKSLEENRKSLNGLYNVTLFPSYLVVNNKGVIIDVPHSAVLYIKENYCYKNWVITFWKEILFTKDCILFYVMSGPYTIMFWITVLVVMLVKRRKSKSREIEAI